MGLPHESATTNRTVKPGNGSIWLDNVKCKGDETNILDCQRNKKKHNCVHTEDVGVICKGKNECINPNKFKRNIGKGYCAYKMPGCMA